MVVGQFSQDVDILVIGGGPAGYTAAFRCAELGKTVGLVDPNDSIGGECLHNACIPSKSSLHGVSSDQVISVLSNGLEKKCKALGIERLHGLAHFENAKTVQITGEVVSVVKFRKAIIASGTKDREELHFANAQQVERVYKDAPTGKNILVVGNTPIAVEAITFLSELNTVSLWNQGDLLPMIHPSLTKLLTKTLRKNVTICDEMPSCKDFDICYLASHREPQIESLQLANANVKVVEKCISVNEACQTSNPRIYAVGECSGCEHSAALAIAQGRVAGEAACGLDAQIDASCVPQVIWSNPELAQCGDLESGVSVSIKWGNSGLAMALGQQQGVTTLSYDPESQAILGVGIFGVGATEMISEAVLAIEMGATLYDIATSLRPHPTRSEMLSEAARQALSTL